MWNHCLSTFFLVMVVGLRVVWWFSLALRVKIMVPNQNLVKIEIFTFYSKHKTKKTSCNTDTVRR